MKNLKKMLTFRVIVLLCVINFTTLFSQDNKIVEKTSFDNVTSKLDKQGSCYLYLSTSNFLESAEESIDQICSMLSSIPFSNEKDKMNAVTVLNMIKSLIMNSGIKDITGVGISSIAIEKDFYRNRFIMHHYKNNKQGKIWNLFGESPHPLSSLDLLPKNTAIASFSDINLSELWSWISNEINNSKNDEIINKFNEFQVNLRDKQGIDITKLLASINNKMGLIVTLDQDKTVSMPIQRNIVEIPEPGIALVLYVNNDYLFNVIDSKCPPSMQRVNDDKCKKILMAEIPILPISFGPSIVQEDNILIIESNIKLVNNILDSKVNKNGFRTSEEFKHLSQNIPANGNSFDLITPEFGKTYINVYKQMMKSNKGLPPEAINTLNMFLDNSNELSLYSVFQNTEEGFVSTFNSNVKAGPVLFATAVIAPVSIMAAMLLPSLSGVQNKAKATSCLANLNGLGKGMLLSADDRADLSFPKTLDQLVDEHYASPSLLKCKYTGKKYIYKSGYSVNDDPNKILIICDHGELGGNYLTVGGYARNYKAGNKPE